MTDPGGQPPGRCCGTILNRDAWPLPTDASTRRDLLVLLPVDATEPVSHLRLRVVGENGLRVDVEPATLEQGEHTLEARIYAADLGPAAADGHHITRGWVARIPVMLTPTRPWDIGGVRYPLSVTAAYTVAGQERSFSSRAAVDAQVASAVYEMGIASAFLPLCCLVAAVKRWMTTR